MFQMSWLPLVYKIRKHDIWEICTDKEDVISILIDSRNVLKTHASLPYFNRNKWLHYKIRRVLVSQILGILQEY